MLHFREAFPKSFHNIPSLHVFKLVFCFQVINSAHIEFGLLEKKRGGSYYKNAFILRLSLAAIFSGRFGTLLPIVYEAAHVRIF